VQHLLADMAAAVLLLEAATADVFGPATENAPLEPLSWQLKCLAARVGRQLGEGALQVHGGIAFTIEHELHRAVQHILALQGLYGDEKELARQLGRALLLGELEPWA
jgi:alkylation response protein AidB-like acyl-CoA dehydrogenase